MFTGLVEATAAVVSAAPVGSGIRLVLQPPPELHRQVARGDSVAVNGLCLSAVSLRDGRMEFDVIPESLRCSNLGALAVGDRVNLETALRAGEPLGGHLVSGHIDCTGEVAEAPAGDGDEARLKVRLQADWGRFLFTKGSIALNGVSVTISQVQGSVCTVHLIPITLADTNLGQLSTGDMLNVEIDQIARYLVDTAERLKR